jgi:hypothetical protein
MAINGIIMMGTGLGAGIYGVITYVYFNPNNLPSLEGYYPY